MDADHHYQRGASIFGSHTSLLASIGQLVLQMIFNPRPGALETSPVLLWFFGQGLLAWLAAVLALGLVNLTPLCVGQEMVMGSMTCFVA